jgi:hypothetical protein
MRKEEKEKRRKGRRKKLKEYWVSIDEENNSQDGQTD